MTLGSDQTLALDGGRQPSSTTVPPKTREVERQPASAGGGVATAVTKAEAGTRVTALLGSVLGRSEWLAIRSLTSADDGHTSNTRRTGRPVAPASRNAHKDV